MTTYVLAIDQGTTSSRAILFRPDTSIAAVAQQEFTQHYPASGWVEHAPEDLWSTTVETCREDDNVADAAAKMGAKQIRRLAVLNDQGKLAGIISLGDIATDYGAKKVGQTLEEISEQTPAAH